MSTLKSLLGATPKRQSVIDDACQVLDLEVADKSGLSGMAVKTAYAVVKGIKPGFVRQVVDALLDEFLDALQPIYEEALARDVEPAKHLLANASPAADALLAVTDGKVDRAERQVIRKTYSKLRPSAKKHVEAAIPRLAEMLQRQLASS